VVDVEYNSGIGVVESLPVSSYTGRISITLIPQCSLLYSISTSQYHPQHNNYPYYQVLKEAAITRPGQQAGAMTISSTYVRASIMALQHPVVLTYVLVG
jgi:hypothetical protein